MTDYTSAPVFVVVVCMKRKKHTPNQPGISRTKVLCGFFFLKSELTCGGRAAISGSQKICARNLTINLLDLREPSSVKLLEWFAVHSKIATNKAYPLRDAS